MSGLITRVTRINGVEEQRSTCPHDLDAIDKVTLDVGTFQGFMPQEVEVEIIFDPPVRVPESPEEGE